MVANNDEGWRRLAAFSSRSEKDLVWRASVAPADISTFLSYLDEQSSGDKSLPLMWQASLGDGRIRMIEQLQPEADETTSEVTARLLQRRREAERLGGSLTIERAPSEISSQISSWGNFGAAAQVMQRIKQQLDPDGILAPGSMI